MTTVIDAAMALQTDETVTVPAVLFLDLINAVGWVAAMAADVNLTETDDPDSVRYLTSEANAIEQRAKDWVAQNWRELPKSNLDF
jgi:hypothetical protein